MIQVYSLPSATLLGLTALGLRMSAPETGFMKLNDRLFGT